MSKRLQDSEKKNFDEGEDQSPNRSPHIMCPNTEHKAAPIITEIRLKNFRKKVNGAFYEARQHLISVKCLTEKVNQDSADPFSAEEIEAALIQMTDANQVFVADGTVFRI